MSRVANLYGQRPEESENLSVYRGNAVRVAKDFNYGDDVVKKLVNAKTENEISSILATARNRRFKTW